MAITKQHWIAAIAAIVIGIGVGLGVWHARLNPPAAATSMPTATSSPVVQNTTASSTRVAAPKLGPFSIRSSDTILSWDFKGGYTGNDTQTAKVKEDIAHLTSLLGKGQYDDYDLYIGLGNDYGLLGDGKGAYDSYNKAIQVHPTKGLVYANLGHLMDELHAYRTAADAYAKAVAVEPWVLEYHLERLTYLTQQFPKDTALVTAAFADADKQFGGIAQVLSIQAQWFESQGRYTDAITAWQRVKTLSPGRDLTAVDAAIARDQAKASLTQ